MYKHARSTGVTNWRSPEFASGRASSPLPPPPTSPQWPTMEELEIILRRALFREFRTLIELEVRYQRAAAEYPDLCRYDFVRLLDPEVLANATER